MTDIHPPASDHAPVVLVTGAAGGIGRVLVQRLASRGVRVAAVGRDPSRLNPLAADLRIVADVTTPEGAAAAVTACRESLGLPTGLAHLVGSTLIAPLHRTKADAFREVVRVNLESAFHMLAAWIEALRGDPAAARGASAVFASSVVSRIGVANHEAIAAAKGGVDALVRSAAATYAGQGIRVNAVAPGMTETPMTAGLLKLAAMREAAAAQYPLGGVQTADDVAAVCDWLLSPGAGRLTGQVLPVDGGFAAIRPLVKSG
jgi:NAD(P)-dependent dehydrogenase (short-subunit alcohol dehydrogenase family)